MPTLTPTSGNRSRLPSRPDAGILDVAAVVEAGLDEHPAGANRFGIFGDQRALLRESAAAADSSTSR